MVGVRVVEAFREAIDENAWVRGLNLDFRIRAIVVTYWEEKISGGLVRVAGAERAVLTLATIFAFVVKYMVSNDRMNPHFAKEAAFGFDNAE